MADTSLTFSVIGRDRASATLAKVGRNVNQTRSRLERLSESSLLARSGLSGMATAGLALGPALLPVLAGATAGVAGLAPALAGAGAAAGVFGLAASGVAGRLKEVIEAAKDGGKAVPAAFRPAVAAFNQMRGAWGKFLDSVQAPTLDIFARGFRIVAGVLPKIKPLFDVTAAAVSNLLGRIERFTSGGGFTSWVQFLTGQARPAFAAFTEIALNLARTFGDLLRAFAPMAQGVLSGLVSLTAGMARWSAQLSSSSGFRAFVDYVRSSGPQIVATLKAVGAAFVNIIAAVAPLGPIVLRVVQAVASLIARIPPNVLGAITAGFIGLAVAMKAAATASALFSTIMAISGGPVTAIVIAVAALAAGLLFLYRNTATVRNGFAAVAAFVSGTLMPALRQFGSSVLAGLRAAWEQVRGAIERNRAQFQQVGAVLARVVGWLVSVGIPALGRFAGAWIQQMGRVIATAITVIAWIIRIGTAIASALGAAARTVASVWSRVRSVTIGTWSAIRAAVSRVLSGIRSAVTSAGSAIRSAISRAWAAARSATTSAWSAIRSAVSRGISAMLGLVRSIPGRVRGAVGNLGGVLFSAGASLVQGLINGIRSRIGAVTAQASRLAGLVARVLPGSPVKEGPLRVLNRGYAGGQIAGMVAEGINTNLSQVAAAARRMASVAATAGPVAAVAGVAPVTAPVGTVTGHREPPIVVQLNIGGHSFGELVVDTVRREVRHRGGTGANSVQVALGRRA